MCPRPSRVLRTSTFLARVGAENDLVPNSRRLPRNVGPLNFISIDPPSHRLHLRHSHRETSQRKGESASGGLNTRTLSRHSCTSDLYVRTWIMDIAFVWSDISSVNINAQNYRETIMDTLVPFYDICIWVSSRIQHRISSTSDMRTHSNMMASVYSYSYGSDEEVIRTSEDATCAYRTRTMCGMYKLICPPVVFV